MLEHQGIFYLLCANAGFNEYRGLTEPRRCRIVARAADAHRLNQAFSETPFDGLKFNPITEHQVFSQHLDVVERLCPLATSVLLPAS